MFYTRLLGFDFGTKKIGVAYGQTLTCSAKPLKNVMVREGGQHWDDIRALIQTWRPEALIVGLPINMDGSPQSITQAAENFAKALHEHFQLPIFMMDERLTTVEARSQLFERGGFKALQQKQVDAVAAALILESWMAEKSDSLNTSDEK